MASPTDMQKTIKKNKEFTAEKGEALFAVLKRALNDTPYGESRETAAWNAFNAKDDELAIDQKTLEQFCGAVRERVADKQFDVSQDIGIIDEDWVQLAASDQEIRSYFIAVGDARTDGALPSDLLEKMLHMINEMRKRKREESSGVKEPTHAFVGTTAEPKSAPKEKPSTPKHKA